MQLVEITLTQLINMFFFMAIGYVFRKKNILDVLNCSRLCRQHKNTLW